VAVVALQQGMRSHQRKTILVIANLIERRLPTFHCVAALAVGAELAAVNVGVAISAMGTYILEDQAGMALRAAHLFVHSTQRITSVVMIEFGIRSNGFPTRIGMALLTGNRDRTMRVGYLGLRTTYAWPIVPGLL
jgi:hypothetical protein